MAAPRKATKKRRSTTKSAPKGKRPVGRPTTYDPKYCEEMVTYCKQGFSLTGFAGHIGVSRETITQWGRVHPEFSLAVSRAKAAAGQAWEARAIIVGSGAGGPGAGGMIQFALKNLAGDDWVDRQEVQTNGTVTNINVETTQEQFDAMARRLLKEV